VWQPQFRWLERGTGDAVVLLHGLMGHMHDWDPVRDILGDSVRAMAPELPLFDPATDPVSIERLASWVLSFLDALELPRVILGGHSLGAHVAIAAALMAPARVSRLVLTGASGLPERGVMRRVPRSSSEAFIRERMEAVFFDRSLVTAEAVAAVRRSVLDPVVARRFLRVSRAARRETVAERLHEVAAPTLLVWGREDRITPLSIGERFRRNIPDAMLVVLRECGHAPMIERPAAFGAIARAWIDEQHVFGRPPAGDPVPPPPLGPSRR
jgi:pimeloyl-ACP methyl ester carboxylesterase